MPVTEQKVKLTPTERKLYKFLSDGLPHTMTAMLLALGDEQRDSRSISVLLCGIRKKLPPGKVIHAVYGPRKTTYYRMFRTISRDR